ncbi:holo-acyl-carrier-protein synthase [Hydrogenobaculum sp. Y04AAS1]|uniref:Holo-[acyl-carrier-protein] synthase n=1 Tax=Hydrogenobaculum sp. (strain Y04AAS1) TaxID=380749 RepID=ACPS_HYDS0|nr:RecName: Full=Holo-[acyl-carrier-protein] synthase; Short=Holo-ACP synthase; AltName: Full=4'-phosphopantetheinyl transferase AcpS [Hydrogenobaculum sp. Y04AAS1]ACG57208.1 holo-acyl-carrier-protein synthase [Hydrogenobaculum sp. Y04AAS1]HCT66395.1 holo-ACP synthase [Hydrogenobaculum sp.]
MLGIDIIKNIRIAKALERFGYHFLNRVYTEYEINLCKMNVECLSGRFAAKEASIKAFSFLSIRRFSFRDFEVVKSKNGIPELRIKDAYINDFLKAQKLKPFISISHEKEFSVAVCYITKEERIC